MCHVQLGESNSKGGIKDQVGKEFVSNSYQN